MELVEYGIDGSSVTSYAINTTHTFTTNSSTYSIRFRTWHSGGGEIPVTSMLVKGNAAKDYVPYNGSSIRYALGGITTVDKGSKVYVEGNHLVVTCRFSFQGAASINTNDSIIKLPSEIAARIFDVSGKSVYDSASRVNIMAGKGVYYSSNSSLTNNTFNMVVQNTPTAKEMALGL